MFSSIRTTALRFSGAAIVALFAAQLCVAQFAPAAQTIKGAWMDKSLSPDKRADLVIEKMTLDEKIQLVHGAGIAGFGPTDPSIVRSNGGGGFVPGIARFGLPDLNMDDSAVGVGGGAHRGRYSTALPSALALASSWDLELARETGALIGRELADQGYNVSLGGGVNITREARNGQIVVARMGAAGGDEVTVKRFRKRGREIVLLPENPAFAPIVVDPRITPFAIEGIGVGLVRSGSW